LLCVVGKRLGHYEILEKIGEGGMGEVYRARDTRLNRTVAIKVLPGRLSAQPDLRQRFEREARAISSLNHPHICTLYDIGEQDGENFLVMEYLDGETLEKRLSKGPLPADQGLRLGVEIAEALDRAHRQGIVHRDLKPGNIMLTKSGSKLLDFGLAKLKPALLPVAAALTEMATESRKLTEQGMILGTLQYMSPEQLEGKEADARTDIFALGAVLFEMVTGRPAFTGKSKASLIAAILAADPPPISQLQPMTPPALDRAVRRCLAKDPDERWQTARDLAAELKWMVEGSSVTAGYDRRQEIGARRAPPQRERLAWATAAAVLLLTTITSMVAYLRLGRAPAPSIVAEILPPGGAQFSFAALWPSPPALSPDGHALAFVAADASETRLWVRPLDSSSAQALPGTDQATGPFWSADSRSIGFFADGKLKTIEAAGGPVVTLCDAPYAAGGSWNRQGIILYGPYVHKGLYKIAASGGTPIPVTTLDESRFSYHGLPHFLPDDKHFLYWAGAPDPASSGVYFSSLDSKENRMILRTDGHAVYASGFLVYSRGTALMAQAFDAGRGQLKGEPHQLLQGASVASDVFAVCGSGLLAYQPGGASAGRELTWFDRAGKKLGTIGAVAGYFDVRLSPDGRRLAFAMGDPFSDVWVDELARGVNMRLTFDPDTDKGVPVWSPDGTRILFGAWRGGKGRVGIYEKASSGAGNEELVLPSESPDAEVWATDWSRDGRFIIYSRGELYAKSRAEIWVLPLAGDRKPHLFLQTPVAAYDAVFSPDGRWVAYTSKESSREEVYVVPFDPNKFLRTGAAPASPAGKWQVSTDGGSSPRWRGDGKELFYVAGRKIMAAEVNGKGNSFEVATPRPLFSAALGAGTPPYDVSSDGKRFLINTTGGGENPPLTLVTNWMARLQGK
jgi:Tol biopolymer transport system component/predicted Ser/Thr protein kinase